MAGNDHVETFYTKECEGVAKVLKEAGFLDEVKTFKPKGKGYKGMRLNLSFEDDAVKVSEIERMSKPGRRLYVSKDSYQKVAGGHGVLVVSTSKGIMSGQEAKKKKLGGELICKVF